MLVEDLPSVRSKYDGYNNYVYREKDKHMEH